MKKRFCFATRLTSCVMSALMLFMIFMEAPVFTAVAAPVIGPPTGFSVISDEAYEYILFNNNSDFIEYSNSEKPEYSAHTKSRMRIAGKDEWFYTFASPSLNSAETQIDKSGIVSFYFDDTLICQYFKDYITMREPEIPEGVDSDIFATPYPFFDFSKYTLEVQLAHMLRDARGNEYSSEWSESIFCGKDGTHTEISENFEKAPQIVSVAWNTNEEYKREYYVDINFNMQTENDRNLMNFLRHMGYGVKCELLISYDGGTPIELEKDYFTYVENGNDGADFCFPMKLFEKEIAEEIGISMQIIVTDFYGEKVICSSERSELSKAVKLSPLGFKMTPGIKDARLVQKKLNYADSEITAAMEYVQMFVDEPTAENAYVEYSVKIQKEDEWTDIGSFPMQANENISIDNITDKIKLSEDTESFYIRTRYVMHTDKGEDFTSEWSGETECKLTETSDSEAETDNSSEKDENEEKANTAKCTLCHMCNKPFGLCIFGWIIMGGAVVAAIIISGRKKPDGQEKKSRGDD